MTIRLRQPVLALGALVAGLLAMRAAAPFVSPPRSAFAEVASPRPAVAAADPPGSARRGDRGQPVPWRGGRPVPGRRRCSQRCARSPCPAGGSRADRGLIRRGETVVAVHGGIACTTTGESGRPPAPLGPASYALAASDPRRVWLVEETGDPERWFRVREVEIGPSPGAALELARGMLPLRQRPVAGVPGGLLLYFVGPGGGLAVWDPRTGRLRQRFGTRAPVTVVAVSGGPVAWVEGTDPAPGRSGRRPRLGWCRPPAGSGGFAPAGAFSPDGRVLAAVTQVGFSIRPALALVRVDRAEAVPVAGSEGALSDRCSPCLAWAPAGDWVFFNRLGPGFGIGAYRLGPIHGRPGVPLDVPGSFPPSLQTL